MARDGAPSLTLADEGGKERARVSVSKDGEPRVAVMDYESRAGAILRVNGRAPQLELYDRTGKNRAMLAAQEDEMVRLLMTDRDGKLRVALGSLGDGNSLIGLYNGENERALMQADANGRPQYDRPIQPREDQLPIDPSTDVPDGFQAGQLHIKNFPGAGAVFHLSHTHFEHRILGDLCLESRLQPVFVRPPAQAGTPCGPWWELLLLKRQRPAPCSIGVRKGAEHFDEIAMLLQLLDGLGDFLLLEVAIAIHEKVILPRLAFAGTGLDLRHIDFEPAHGRQRAVQGADFVRDAQHQTRAITSTGGTALAAQHEKSRRIDGIVLNAGFEDHEMVAFGGQ